mgnify:CR=1 FL=1
MTAKRNTTLPSPSREVSKASRAKRVAKMQSKVFQKRDNIVKRAAVVQRLANNVPLFALLKKRGLLPAPFQRDPLQISTEDLESMMTPTQPGMFSKSPDEIRALKIAHKNRRLNLNNPGVIEYLSLIGKSPYNQHVTTRVIDEALYKKRK